MLPEAEPLPGFGRENMTELSAYFGQVATQKAIATFPKMREPAPRPINPEIQTTCFADHVCKYLYFSLYFFIITLRVLFLTVKIFQGTYLSCNNLFYDKRESGSGSGFKIMGKK